MLGKILMLLFIILTLILSFKLLFSAISPARLPIYNILQDYRDFQLRQYPEMLFASVVVPGNREKALSTGFSILANYILGKNQSKLKMKMEAPVMQQKTAEGWKISFVMPTYYDLSDLPKPDDERIQLHLVPAHNYIVYRFNGKVIDDFLQQEMDYFKKFLVRQDFKIRGEPIYAFYSPPWTMSFLRRNEIWYLVEEKAQLTLNSEDMLKID
jgi:hypothetical protein